MQDIIAPGRLAVVTGAASGIGAALARALEARGMTLALIDRDGPGLAALARSLGPGVLAVTGDLARAEDCGRFAEAVLERFGAPALLVNNAGLLRRPGPWAAPEAWREVLDVNFTATLRLQHLFVPAMLAGGARGAVVNLGSKEGITTPPGQAGYAVAKAAVKVLTEQLAHALRQESGDRLTAHLLVPGYTFTPMNFPETPAEKPPAPWSAEELVAHALARLAAGDFYILCPDNEVTPEMDARRIRWAAEDMIQNRPALSRWHPDHAEAFARWMAR